MKTTINKLAAGFIFVLLLLAGNVRAEGNDVTASSLENTMETSLQLENWMTDETVWTITNTAVLTVEAETGLEMENWMTNESTWEVKHPLLSETETDLQLEGWMTNNKIWNI